MSPQVKIVIEVGEGMAVLLSRRDVVLGDLSGDHCSPGDFLYSRGREPFVVTEDGRPLILVLWSGHLISEAMSAEQVKLHSS